VSSVRDTFYGIARELGMTRIFSNPGSTEVPLLVDMPDDFEFVLALHEGSVVGLATGWAIGRGEPALVLLHTTAGLGNAVGALATARVNRAPLVVLVGQQDRRHLHQEPFLTGRLSGLAGQYPVWVGEPAHAADVPSLVQRAYHEAQIHRGPALVIVPMNDWSVPMPSGRFTSPTRMRSTVATNQTDRLEVAELLTAARSPVIVVGAGADHADTWSALTKIAKKSGAPVWQEAFGARAGFPQDHPSFAGHLPASRSGVREALAGHDLVLVVGAPSLRQYQYEEGELYSARTRVVVVTDDYDEAAHSVANLAVVAPLPQFCKGLAAVLLESGRSAPQTQRPMPLPASESGNLEPADVFRELAQRLPAESTIVEESPSSRSLLQDLLPARAPLGYLSAAMGGLGFALPASTGLKMALPRRPVVAIVGDGSSQYSIQALWSAHRYDVGVLFVVLSNGGYRIMDVLAAKAGGPGPWPGFADVSIRDLGAAYGCKTHSVATLDELTEVLDELAQILPTMTEPVLLDVVLGGRPDARAAAHRRGHE